jgi:hypothetical protein
VSQNWVSNVRSESRLQVTGSQFSAWTQTIVRVGESLWSRIRIVSCGILKRNYSADTNLGGQKIGSVGELVPTRDVSSIDRRFGLHIVSYAGISCLAIALSFSRRNS